MRRYKRRRYSGRRSSRGYRGRRRFTRRSRFKRNIRRAKRHAFNIKTKFTIQATNISFPQAGGVVYSTVSPGSVTGFGAYCEMFDEYMFAGMKYTLIPRKFVNTDGSIQNYPMVAYQVDDRFYAGGTIGWGTLINRSGAKMRNCRRPINIFFRPSLYTTRTEQSGGSDIVNTRSFPRWPWTPTKAAQTTVSSSGVYIGNEAYVSADPVIMGLYITFYFKFRKRNFSGP